VGRLWLSAGRGWGLELQHAAPCLAPGPAWKVHRHPPSPLETSSLLPAGNRRPSGLESTRDCRVLRPVDVH